MMLPSLLSPRNLSALLLGFSSACSVGYDASGAWTGSCTIQEYDGPVAISFRLEVQEPEPGILDGKGSFWYRDREFLGGLHGERYAEEVELTLDGDDGGHGTRLGIAGILDGDTLLGDCSLYGVLGSLSMERGR